jgi:hypothetical protein
VSAINCLGFAKRNYSKKAQDCSRAFFAVSISQPNLKLLYVKLIFIVAKIYVLKDNLTTLQNSIKIV